MLKFLSILLAVIMVPVVVVISSVVRIFGVKLMTAKDCNEQFNASRIASEFVIGEAQEILEAIIKRDRDEFFEEIADVCYFGLCWLEGKYGINLPMVGATPTIVKVQKRLNIWEGIFADYGLAFDKKYLVGGSNYKKQVKIDAAISLARQEQVK